MNYKINLENYLSKPINVSSNEELYVALLNYIKDVSKTVEHNSGNRKLYYISAEFLIGKLLSNNLINLGIREDVSELLKSNGKDLNEIEEVELEPSLGNGGLGRLAACFLDSISTLGLNGDGMGLNYHFGLFKQLFENNKQIEIKNDWITNDSWLIDTESSFVVPFKNFDLKAKLYDIDVIGYHNNKNKLHLFDVETIDESIVKENISFDKTAIEKNLTLFLYPDDSDENGHLLRIYQQYFLVSCSAQYIINELKKESKPLKEMDKYVVIQINDTHPSLVIPELIRLLMAEGISMQQATEIVSKTCAYTNHTILQEALEKWPYKYLQQVTPLLMDIIDYLDKKIKAIYRDENLHIIDKNSLVHMARLDIHYCFSVNGVAAIHTDILKNTELKQFNKIYPTKFNNKTNGITFRRWLLHSNPELTNYIASLIGDGFKTNADELEKLLVYKNDKKVLNDIYQIKHLKKQQLAKVILEKENITIDPNSVISIQIKRLHEYKRQQMNALYIIYKYLEIKKGIIPTRPITMIFGAKAAPAYYMAKNIIHLLLSLSKLIRDDVEVSKYLNVVMVENYNVTYAEKLITAADISEQISLASKEASGTGNMKFMLNGAVTLGTLDGANVEISELVEDNIYLFGEKAEQVIKHYENKDYISKEYYTNSNSIKAVLDFIISKELKAIGDVETLTALYNELLNKDWFMTLLDLEDYIKTKDQMIKDYEDKERWEKMMLVNIAKAGFFSSDRTIKEYNRDIWKLK